MSSNSNPLPLFLTHLSWFGARVRRHVVDLIQTRSTLFSLKGDHRTFFEESLNKESVNKFSFRLILHRKVFFAQIYEYADA